MLVNSRALCTVARKQFWRNVGTVDTKRAAKKLRNATWSDFKSIFSLALPHKKRILLGLGFLGVSSSIFLISPRVLGKVLDEYNDAKKKEPPEAEEKDLSLRLAKYFKENPSHILPVFFLGAVAICARAYCMHTAGQLVVNDLRTKVFSSVLKQDIAFFDRNKVGEIVSRLSTDALIVGYSVSTNLSEGARAVVTSIGSAGLMVVSVLILSFTRFLQVYTSLALCKVVAVVIPVIVGTFYVFGKLQRKYTMQMQEAVAGANQVATERLSNIRTVRMLVAEEKELNAYKEKINDIWNISRKEGLAKGLMFGGFQFTGYVSLSAILFYGSKLINDGLLSYGDLSSFCLYALLCAGSLSNMSGFFTELMKGLGASTRLFELQSQRPTIPMTGGLKIANVHRDIRFESVAFSYPDRAPIFNDITFRIPAGQVTAVVGPSGSGKSTIASLLLRLYNPTQGRIMVDNNDLRELDPSHWRRMIGTVGQEPVLFSTTIRNNIVYGSDKPDEISDEQVMEAAEQAHALEFIRSFPDSFQTMVGEHGASMLSGGQKQRIAIARALCTKPKVLILDEATSSLDATSEYFVRKALSRLLENNKQTVLTIAHRLSTIKHANTIVVLDRGTIAELGAFDELMRIPDGIFRRLVEKQTIGWREDNF
ncbi:p-glycoprotein b [Aphelenchoides avenae]|nr:p-glycoprotein b [Aphelenchus avenae]